MSNIRPNKYVLDASGQRAIPATDTIEWARWFQTADRIVAVTDIPGLCRVSTVFLGLTSGDVGPPLLWETMIFEGPRDGDTWRFPSRAAAEIHHRRLVAELQGTINERKLEFPPN